MGLVTAKSDQIEKKTEWNGKSCPFFRRQKGKPKLENYLQTAFNAQDFRLQTLKSIDLK